MALTQQVAKAGVVREDGKVFDANTLKMFAEEAPEKYRYLEGQEELWMINTEDEKNVNVG